MPVVESSNFKNWKHNRNSSQIIAVISSLSLIFFGLLFCILMTTACSQQVDNKHLNRDDWSDDVKTAINSLIDTYGESGSKHTGNEYAVFDFDNTTAIGDIVMAYYYRLESMAFNQTPDGFKEILSSNLGKSEVKLDTPFTYKEISNTTYNELIGIAVTYYSELYSKYGPFNGDGLSEEMTDKLKDDATWNKFMTSMILLVDTVLQNEEITDKQVWILAWGTGMTPKQIYNNAYRALAKYSQLDIGDVYYSADIDFPAGPKHVEVKHAVGVNVTENIKELYKSLACNDIDVYVCSASPVPVVEAAVDYFGLTDNCSGIAAIDLSVDSSGHYQNQFNSNNKWYSKNGEDWIDLFSGVTQFTSGTGKVTAIKNGLMQKYGVGPLACFGDSTGDYNFCTEFASTKLVTCFNRATLDPTDGGALIAEIAMYQKENLNYDFSTANEAGDTLYVLQGRNDTKKGTFRNSNKTITNKSDGEILFKGEANYAQLKYIQDNKLTTKQAIEKLCIKSSDTSLFGYKYGFVKEYAGYHNIQ